MDTATCCWVVVIVYIATSWHWLAVCTSLVEVLMSEWYCLAAWVLGDVNRKVNHQQCS